MQFFIVGISGLFQGSAAIPAGGTVRLVENIPLAVFLNPWAFWLFLLAVPVVLCYLLKVRLKEKTIPTMIFWREVFQERRSRALWRRLRYWVSLLISLLFLTVLIFAVLNPAYRSDSRSDLVIVFDNSGSMNALDGKGNSRFTEAKKSLKDFINNIEDRETAVLTSGGGPRTVVGWTSSATAIRSKIEFVKPTDANGSLDETLDLAERLSQGRPRSRIIVLTDGEEMPSEKWIRSEQITWFFFGEPEENTAITRFQPRRSFSDSTGFEILVEITRFGKLPVDCRLELDLDGVPIDVIPLSIEPGRSVTRVIPAVSASGGILTATLTGADALTADNTARAVLPDRKPQKILFQDPLGYFLDHVFRSIPLVQLEQVQNISDHAPKGSVWVFEDKIPNRLSQGSMIIVNPLSDTDLFQVKDLEEIPLVSSQKDDSPIMKFVHLKNVLITGAKKIIPKPGTHAHILAQTPEGNPLLLLFERSEGNVLVLSADLNRGDLALRIAFPVIMTNALNWFRNEGGELETVCSAGDVFVSEGIAGKNRKLRSPSGELTEVSGEAGMIGPLNRCGLWRLENGDGSVFKTIACNMNSSKESDLSGSSNIRFLKNSKNEVGKAESFRRPVWFWLTLTALFLTGSEWFLYQRRWID